MGNKLLLILTISALIFLSGCVSKDPKGILLNAYEKSKGIDEFTMNYDLRYKLTQGAVSYQFNGTMEVVKSGKNSFVGVKILSPLTETSTESYVYNLNGKEITCSKILSGFYCRETTRSESSFLGTGEFGTDPESQKELLIGWLGQGIVSLSDEGQGFYFGRKCDKISVDFDMDKFLSNLTKGLVSIEKDKAEMELSMCLDKEAGTAIWMLIYVNIDVISYEMEFIGKDMKFEADEKLLVLPVPEDKVVWKENFTTATVGCSSTFDGICPPNCAAGADYDCCIEKGYKWIVGEGCY